MMARTARSSFSMARATSSGSSIGRAAASYRADLGILTSWETSGLDVAPARRFPSGVTKFTQSPSNRYGDPAAATVRPPILPDHRECRLDADRRMVDFCYGTSPPRDYVRQRASHLPGQSTA